MESTVLLAALGIVSACVGALVWIIKIMFEKITPLLELLMAATSANTEATKSADVYLRERNGRDNAFHKEVIDKLQEIPLHADMRAKEVSDELKRVQRILRIHVTHYYQHHRKK